MKADVFSLPVYEMRSVLLNNIFQQRIQFNPPKLEAERVVLITRNICLPLLIYFLGSVPFLYPMYSVKRGKLNQFLISRVQVVTSLYFQCAKLDVDKHQFKQLL